MKHWRVALRNDSALWDKKFLTEIRDARPSLIPNIFQYLKFWIMLMYSSEQKFD